MLNRHLLRCALAAALAVFTAPAHAGGQFSFGVEGFADRYREPAVDVTVDTGYGSVTGGYTYSSPRGWFGAVDARASYGKDNYKSPSGTSSGVDEYEGELRLRFGAVLHEFGGIVAPYTGLGGRSFLDNGSGTMTSLGYYGYDRVINQLYVPLGIAYSYRNEAGWSFTPMIEYDALVYGRVESKLAPITGFDVTNTQSDGYALRGELMVGHQFGSHEVQFGPFVRYWDIKDSDGQPDLAHPGYYFYEPHNTRLQAGAALRVKL